MCARFQPSAVIAEEIRSSLYIKPPNLEIVIFGHRLLKGSLLAKLNNLLLILKLKFFNHVTNHVNNLNPRRTVRTSSVPWRISQMDVRKMQILARKTNSVSRSKLKKINKNMWTNTNIRNCIHVTLIFDKLWN